MQPPPDEDDDAPSADEPPRRGGRRAKGPRKAFLLRLSPELHAELRGWAQHELRSLNAHVEYLLREAVRRRRGRHGEDEPRD